MRSAKWIATLGLIVTICWPVRWISGDCIQTCTATFCLHVVVSEAGGDYLKEYITQEGSVPCYKHMDTASGSTLCENMGPYIIDVKENQGSERVCAPRTLSFIRATGCNSPDGDLKTITCATTCSLCSS